MPLVKWAVFVPTIAGASLLTIATFATAPYWVPRVAQRVPSVRHGICAIGDGTDKREHWMLDQSDSPTDSINIDLTLRVALYFAAVPFFLLGMMCVEQPNALEQLDATFHRRRAIIDFCATLFTQLPFLLGIPFAGYICCKYLCCCSHHQDVEVIYRSNVWRSEEEQGPAPRNDFQMFFRTRPGRRDCWAQLKSNGVFCFGILLNLWYVWDAGHAAEKLLEFVFDPCLRHLIIQTAYWPVRTMMTCHVVTYIAKLKYSHIVQALKLNAKNELDEHALSYWRLLHRLFKQYFNDRAMDDFVEERQGVYNKGDWLQCLTILAFYLSAIVTISVKLWLIWSRTDGGANDTFLQMLLPQHLRFALHSVATVLALTGGYLHFHHNVTGSFGQLQIGKDQLLIFKSAVENYDVNLRASALSRIATLWRKRLDMDVEADASTASPRTLHVVSDAESGQSEAMLLPKGRESDRAVATSTARSKQSARSESAPDGNTADLGRALLPDDTILGLMKLRKKALEMQRTHEGFTLDLTWPQHLQIWWALRNHLHIDFLDEIQFMDLMAELAIMYMIAFAIAGYLVYAYIPREETMSESIPLWVMIATNCLLYAGTFIKSANFCVDLNELFLHDDQILLDVLLKMKRRHPKITDARRRQAELDHMSFIEALRQKLANAGEMQILKLFGALPVTIAVRNRLLLAIATALGGFVWPFALLYARVQRGEVKHD